MFKLRDDEHTTSASIIIDLWLEARGKLDKHEEEIKPLYQNAEELKSLVNNLVLNMKDSISFSNSNIKYSDLTNLVDLGKYVVIKDYILKYGICTTSYV